MVIEELITEKLNELERFFLRARELASSDGDNEAASYGLETTLWMKEVLNKHKSRPKNSFLKQIYGGFFSVTRGVEAFGDLKINQEFNEATNGIYGILNQLEKEIKW